jgi:hypothetical protein
MKMKNQITKILALLLLPGFLFSLASCSHAPIQNESEKNSGSNIVFSETFQENLLDSSVTIEYVLGRDSYKISTESSPSGIDMNLSSNKKILEHGQMSRKLYPDFFKKASDFTQQLQMSSSTSNSCRGPFKITIRMGQKTQMGSGCRSRSSSTFSRLVKEAEFLLYSKN